MPISIRGNKNGILGTVIAVDALSETIQFCTPNEDGGLVTNAIDYKARCFDQEFFYRLTRIIKQQVERDSNLDLQKISLILPDSLFLLDMISVPVIHRKAMQHSLSLAIEAVYKNASELNLMTYGVQQNKQTATFGLVGIRQDTLDSVRKAFAENGLTVSGITYASNAMVNGAMALNSKLRNDTFMMLDLKQDYARFAFAVRGCTMGYYDLPFGYEILHTSRLVAEHLMFDHRAGELLVLNAKERARAKQLTMESSTPPEQQGEGAAAAAQPAVASGPIRKTSRKLPKFMQRPAPLSEAEYIYENFRIFLKWTLELLNNNREIVSLAKLDTVYVNMPEEYHFLFDRINEDQEEHGVAFAPLITEEEDPSVIENLELYGGFFMNRYNSANTF